MGSERAQSWGEETKGRTNMRENGGSSERQLLPSVLRFPWVLVSGTHNFPSSPEAWSCTSHIPCSFATVIQVKLSTLFPSGHSTVLLLRSFLLSPNSLLFSAHLLQVALPWVFFPGSLTTPATYLPWTNLFITKLLSLILYQWYWSPPLSRIPTNSSRTFYPTVSWTTRPEQVRSTSSSTISFLLQIEYLSPKFMLKPHCQCDGTRRWSITG